MISQVFFKGSSIVNNELRVDQDAREGQLVLLFTTQFPPGHRPVKKLRY